MKREICCQKCAEQWREALGWTKEITPGKYPGFNQHNEGMRQVEGVANFDMTCDGCGNEITGDAPAVAVSIYSKSTPYFEWEGEYITAGKTSEGESAPC
jgi:hypothetical protein